jgi:hypothetical protein
MTTMPPKAIPLARRRPFVVMHDGQPFLRPLAAQSQVDGHPRCNVGDWHLRLLFLDASTNARARLVGLYVLRPEEFTFLRQSKCSGAHLPVVFAIRSPMLDKEALPRAGDRLHPQKPRRSRRVEHALLGKFGGATGIPIANYAGRQRGDFAAP